MHIQRGYEYYYKSRVLQIEVWIEKCFYSFPRDASVSSVKRSIIWSRFLSGCLRLQCFVQGFKVDTAVSSFCIWRFPQNWKSCLPKSLTWASLSTEFWAFFFQVLLKLNSFKIFNTISPLTFIYPPIRPAHLPVPVSIVIFKWSFVIRPILPVILTFSTLLIVHVLSLVRVSSWNIPFTSPMSQSWKEFSHIYSTICPKVLSIPFWLAIIIIANIEMSICKFLDTNTILLFIYSWNFAKINISLGLDY